MKKYQLKNVIFEIQKRCNLDCVYCYNHWKGSDDGIRYPERGLYRQALKTLKRLFKISDVARFSFSGGEPFLFERLHELALYCRMKKSAVNIITNGNASKKGDYALFRDIGVGLFELPLQSRDPEVHDRMAGKKGAWNNSVDSLTELKNLAMTVAVVVVLTQYNYKNIGDTLRFVSELGIKTVLVNRYNIGGKNRADWKEISLTPDELKTAYRTINGLAPELGLKVSSGVCSPLCLVNPKEFPNISFGYCSDHPEEMPLALDVFGNVRLCNHSPTIIGNIHQNDFKEIFTGPAAEKWFGAVLEECEECPDLRRCKGGCRAASEQLYGDIRKADPYLQSIK